MFTPRTHFLWQHIKINFVIFESKIAHESRAYNFLNVLSECEHLNIYVQTLKFLMKTKCQIRFFWSRFRKQKCTHLFPMSIREGFNKKNIKSYGIFHTGGGRGVYPISITFLGEKECFFHKK